MEVFIALVIVGLGLLLLWLRHHLSYWKRRAIPHNKPSFPLGNMVGFRKTKHVSQIFTATYNQFKGTGPFAGFYFILIKSVIILDIDLVKNILVKDFNNFTDRGIFHNEVDDPLTGNLFFLDGDKWRRLRQKMSPTFTSGKMKIMFPTVVKVGEELAAVFAEKTASANLSGKPLEIIDLLSRYTADVIGSCAFGLECNSLHDPNAEFVKMGRRFLTEPRHMQLIDGFINSFPELSRRLHMRVVNQSVHDFYMRIVRDTIAYRETNNIKRNDFMDMLIELKNKPAKGEDGVEDMGLTVEELAAQAFVFFLAGFETSSTTMGFALYELAQNEEVQNRLREEIKTVMEKYDNVFSYECMKEMQYLDQVVDETLRLHPVLGHLIRRARERYATADPKYYIEKGTMVIIPSIAIHHDPDFYPEPEKFKPERFAPQEVLKRPACTWLPFGEGPRNCIGMRFGKMQTVIGLAYLLRNFKFSLCSETKVPYNLTMTNFLLSSENGIHLKVEKI